MDQKWIQILVILMFYQRAEADKPTKEGESVDIHCKPLATGSMVIWFRVLDKSGMEFIASFSNNGIRKTYNNNNSQLFSHSKINQNLLTLTSFNKNRDSGIYNCASLYKGNELRFGEVVRLFGEEDTTEAPPTHTTKQSQSVTTTPCVCKDKNKKGSDSPSLFCAPLILGPLAGGCGLLLLLLVVTILYCNRIRTRRCPHHYKRKPRTVAPEKQMMAGRHV